MHLLVTDLALQKTENLSLTQAKTCNIAATMISVDLVFEQLDDIQSICSLTLPLPSKNVNLD